MDENKSLRDRLIHAGLIELEEHGLRDFSLRRVAQGAEVSCAAPYRHFKDKEELILAVISYVRESWELLAENICEVYTSDCELRVVQLSLAALRFWVANGNLRSVIMSGQDELDEARRREVNKFDAPIVGAVREYATGKGIPDCEELAFTVLALVYGTVTLVSCGSVGGSDGAEMLSHRIHALLSQPQIP